MGVMARCGIHQLPVMKQQRLVGMVSRETSVRFLEVRRGLGLAEADKEGAEGLRVGSPPADGARR